MCACERVRRAECAYLKRSEKCLEVGDAEMMAGADGGGGEVGMENQLSWAISPSSFVDHMDGGGVFDYGVHVSLGGFLDLLDPQDLSPAPLLFDLPSPMPQQGAAPAASSDASAFLALHTSPSVSSSSAEAANDPPRSAVTVEEEAGDEDEEQEEKPKQP